MNLESINLIIDDYRRWIAEAEARNQSTEDLQCELSYWEYERTQL